MRLRRIITETTDETINRLIDTVIRHDFKTIEDIRDFRVPKQFNIPYKSLYLFCEDENDHYSLELHNKKSMYQLNLGYGFADSELAQLVWFKDEQNIWSIKWHYRNRHAMEPSLIILNDSTHPETRYRDRSVYSRNGVNVYDVLYQNSFLMHGGHWPDMEEMVDGRWKQSIHSLIANTNKLIEYGFHSDDTLKSAFFQSYAQAKNYMQENEHLVRSKSDLFNSLRWSDEKIAEYKTARGWS